MLRALRRLGAVAALGAAAAVAAAPASAPVPASASTSTSTSTSTASDAGLALLRQRLQLAPVLQGEFEQSKTLQGFRKPLLTRGEFLVARGQGVWWHTRQPFESTLVVTRTRLFTRAADGSSTDALDAQAEPGLRQVNELVFALLSADIEALVARFVVQVEALGPGGWTMTLTPRDAQLAGFLARATLTGDRFVQGVRIDEARGDSTQIRFSHQRPSAALDAADAARLR